LNSESRSSDLPSQVFIVHVANKEWFGGESIRLDFNISSGHLMMLKQITTILIHLRLQTNANKCMTWKITLKTMNNHLVQKTWFSNIWKTEKKRNKVNNNQMFPWNNSNFMHRYCCCNFHQHFYDCCRLINLKWISGQNDSNLFQLLIFLKIMNTGHRII